jgi:hypothetical protein
MTEKTYKDIRVFRFNKDLVVQKGLEGRSYGPVPIFNDAGKIIGFALIKNEAGTVVAECAIDPNTPERLDLETDGRKYWLDAALEYRGFVDTEEEGFVPTLVYVPALALTATHLGGTPVSGGQMS